MCTRRAAWALAVALLATSVTAPAQAPAVDPYLDIPVGGGPIDEGRVPDGLESVDAHACGECHQTAYRQWRRSRHRTSFTNATFREEFEPRRRAFCARCHAPLTSEPGREPELADEGVDCAVCHVRNGAVLNPTVSGDAPHRSIVAPEIAQPLACARCHQFAPEHAPGELLQSTLSEYARSTPGREGQSCQSCHMPRGRHDFPGARDGALLRDALTVRAEAVREGDRTRVVLDLEANDVGHSVPTGDVFRRLEVRAWIAGQPSSAASRTLMRRFRVGRRSWRALRDDRVPPSGGGARRVELAISAVGPRVRYAIDLWLVSERVAARHPAAEVSRPVTGGVVRVGSAP